jgi:hypothetical protein
MRSNVSHFAEDERFCAALVIFTIEGMAKDRHCREPNDAI